MRSQTAVFDEAFDMTDSMQNSTLNALAAHGGQAVNRTLQLVKLGVLVVSVAAAIPTAQNLYYAWKTGVPFNQVQHRLTQAALWEKNFDCRIDYRALSTAAATRVEVGSCAKTGDISIKVTGANNQVNYEWIAFEQLPKPATQQSAGLMGLIISQAIAAEAAQSTAPASALDIKVAQATAAVLCQMKSGDQIIRIVKENNKCVRETVSLFKGTVEKREEIACDNACPSAN